MNTITNHIAYGIAEWVLFSIWNRCEDWESNHGGKKPDAHTLVELVSEETGLSHEDLTPFIVSHLSQEIVNQDGALENLVKVRFALVDNIPTWVEEELSEMESEVGALHMQLKNNKARCDALKSENDALKESMKSIEKTMKEEKELDNLKLTIRHLQVFF